MASGIQYSFERVEKKYMLTRTQRDALLNNTGSRLEVDAHLSYTICNIYYDTNNYRLIRASIEKPVYKEKPRVRSYGVPGEDDMVFIELKKKFDGVVYKRRVTTEFLMVEPFLTGLLEKDTFSQIGKEIDWFQRCNKTVPKVFIGYDRTAFAGVEDTELRVTFDTDLRWRTMKLDLAYGDYGQLLLPQNVVLMEIKFPGVCSLRLGRALSELSIYL